MMAGGIAHEINNPLAVIHASAANISRMAESGAVQVPAVLKNCHRIAQTADRISRIVRSLRHVAREGSADEFPETPVRQIVEVRLSFAASLVHGLRGGNAGGNASALCGCFIENRLDVRHACRPRQLLRLTVPRRLNARVHRLEFLECERSAKHLSLGLNSATSRKALSSGLDA
jgi:signal transduction histidine kinase